MNPVEVYGDLAQYVTEGEDCWTWDGPKVKMSGKYVPGVYENRKAVRPLVRALVELGILASPFRRYYQACDTTDCVHPEHYEPVGTEVTTMILIRDRSEVDGECHLWTGEFSTEGLPTVTTGAKEARRNHMTVHRFVWQVEHGQEFPSDAMPTTTCGRKNCVAPGHVTIRPKLSSAPYTPKPPRLSKAERETLDRREAARLFIEERNREMLGRYDESG